MKMTLLGTGTSHGIPVIACDCPVCKSKNRKDKRLRCSAYVTNVNNDKSVSSILIDITPEFRIQALRKKIKSIDAVLLTHAHSDHIYGIDDIRIFSHTHSCDESCGTQDKGLCFYGNKETIRSVKRRFDYIFTESQIGGGKPKINLKNIETVTEKEALCVGDMEVLPVAMKHGELNTTGYIISCVEKDKQKHSIVYLTDCNKIKGKSIKYINKKAGIIDHIVIDGLREKEHATHFSFLQAMECAEQINTKNVWFTHICHSLSHEEISEYIKENLHKFPKLQNIVMNSGFVEPAYDGLVLRTYR